MDALGAAVAAKAAAEEQLVRERAAKRRVEEEKERLETELARERRRRVEAEAVLEVIGRACCTRSEAEGGGGSPEKLEAKRWVGNLAQKAQEYVRQVEDAEHLEHSLAVSGWRG